MREGIEGNSERIIREVTLHLVEWAAAFD